jgi:hypothetical protein
MVKKRFISKTQPNSNEWVWPVIASSESDREKFLAGLSTYLLMIVIVPRFNLIVLALIWLIFQLRLISYFQLKILTVISGAFWFAIGWLSDFKYLGHELLQSVLWRSFDNHQVLYLSIWILRSIFFASLLSIFCIYYNRRFVNPEKVHVKVVMRQRHERLRHMRRWSREITLKEVI